MLATSLKYVKKLARAGALNRQALHAAGIYASHCLEQQSAS